MKQIDIQTKLSEKLKEMRLQKGMTQEELAKKLYTTQQTVAKWENGKINVSLDALTKLSGIFEVPIRMERGVLWFEEEQIDLLPSEEESLGGAVQDWVASFNAYPNALMKRAYADKPDALIELTMPTVGDTVHAFSMQAYGEVQAILDDMTYEVRINNVDYQLKLEDISIEQDSWLPMWGTMFAFGESLDSEWALNHRQDMSDLGFRVYEDEEEGLVFIGIDGAGYDFYRAHWIPLYLKRGLQWHISWN